MSYQITIQKMVDTIKECIEDIEAECADRIHVMDNLASALTGTPTERRKEVMKVYTCTDHEAHWPVGVASIVVAEDEDRARALLDTELVEHGLLAKEPYTLQEIDLSKAQAIVLCNGDY